MDVARSAERIIRWHNAYVTVDPAHEKSTRWMYFGEVKILIRRCFRLGFYLLTHRKKAVEKQV
jgi:hypothetical protein